MFVVKIWCLYLVSRLLYSVLPETTFFDKNGRTWPQFDLYNFWPWVTSGKIFSEDAWNWCPERYWKFQSAIPNRIWVIDEKPPGGGPKGPSPIRSRVKSADFETFCDWSTSSWRNNLDTPWCNNLVCNNLDDVITLWCDVKIVTPQGHVLFTAFGKLMFEYIFWYEVKMVFKWHGPEILEN